MFTLMNDVPQIEMTEALLEEMKCPSCGKQYKAQKSFIRHINEHNESFQCVPTYVLFEGTTTESIGLKFYTNHIGYFNRNTTFKLSSFRKSKDYANTMRFILQCMKFEASPELLFNYTRLKNKGLKYYQAVLTVAMKETTLRDFRIHMLRNEDLIDSDQFYEANKEDIDNDEVFLYHSLRKAKIGFNYLIDNTNFLDRFDNDMSLGIKEKIQIIADDVIGA